MRLYLNNFVLSEFDPLRPLIPVRLFELRFGHHIIPVSNHMFMIAAAAILLSFLLPIATRSKRLAPRGWQNLIESICVYLREQVARPVLGENTDRYIGFVWTMFFFILTLNLLALVPSDSIVYLLTRKVNHFGGPATANIWVTGALAVVTFLVCHISGILKQGLKNYIVNFIPHVPWPIVPFIYFLEIITAFIRPFALAIRLFANIVAGHTLIATLVGLIIVFKSYLIATASVSAIVAMSVLELLVAFIQAYIFTLLSTLFISFAVTNEH